MTIHVARLSVQIPVLANVYKYVIMFIVDAKFVTIQKIHEFDIDDTKYIYSYVMF